MAIYRKIVKPFGATGHLTVSKCYVDKEAIVVVEDDIDRLSKMITYACLIDPIKDKELVSFRNEINDIKARLGLIERHLTSIGTLGRKSNETHTEPQSAAPEPSA